MANATFPQKTLRIGVDEQLYVGPAAGAINTTGAGSVFGIPPQSSIPRGTIWFQAINRGGTVTAFTANLEVSLDGGTTFSSMQTITFAALPSVQSANVSGIGGNGQLRLNFTTVTLGTGSGADVYAHLG